MANAVARMPEKIATKSDASPKKVAPKPEATNFKSALKKARPKPVHVEPKPAAKAVAKKIVRASKPNAEAPPENAKPEQSDEATPEVTEESSSTPQPTAEALPEKPADTPKAKQGEAAPKPDDATNPAKAEADPAVLVAAINPEAKQQKPQNQSPEDAPEDADSEDGETSPEATTAIQTGQPKSNSDGKRTVDSNAAKVAEATDVDPNAVVSTTESKGDEADSESTADTEPAAKVVKKLAASPASHQQPVDGEAGFGAALQPEKPSTPSQPAANAPDEDSATQPVAELPDRPDAPSPAPAAHETPETHLTIDLDPKAHVPSNVADVRPTPPAPPEAPIPPEARFADANHAQIVTGMRGQLLPDGGTMHIRLDPPELGALQVSVQMKDGIMTASFQTSNDDATKLLSHSLAQLKHVLESQGVSIDKLHVTQAPRDQQAGNEDNRGQQNPSDNPSARQEQQRREILQRMWRKLTNGSDPLDTLA